MTPLKTFQALGLSLDIDEVELPGAVRAGKRARILGKGTYAKVFAARWAPAIDVPTVGPAPRLTLSAAYPRAS